MSETEYERIVWPEGIKEEDKAPIISMLRNNARRKESLSMVYYPSCGCECKLDYIIDRYPMSEIIIGKCPVCEKICNMKISDPPIFYLPILDKEYSLEQIKQMEITRSSQAPYLRAYKIQDSE